MRISLQPKNAVKMMTQSMTRDSSIYLSRLPLEFYKLKIC